MLCPNDNAEMRRVQITSHYGGPIFVDQCDRCGGIWFDESDLFRARQGEADKIEALNAEMLRTPSVIEKSTLCCPRDQGAMQRFTDKYFPQDIVLVRCPSCHGIWLNRGTFTKYQQFRQKLMPKKKSLEEERLGKAMAPLVVAFKYESERSSEADRRDVDTAVNVLKGILWLIFRS